jgi:hypothetical protein
MSKNDKKVIGYIASYSRTEVLFVGDACLVMGSERKLQHHILKNVPEKRSKANFKKIRFVDIMRAINHGEKIVFDEESYNRFHPLGKQIGLQTEAPSCNTNEKSGSNFYLLGPDGLISG